MERRAGDRPKGADLLLEGAHQRGTSGLPLQLLHLHRLRRRGAGRRPRLRDGRALLALHEGGAGRGRRDRTADPTGGQAGRRQGARAGGPGLRRCTLDGGVGVDRALRHLAGDRPSRAGRSIARRQVGHRPHRGRGQEHGTRALRRELAGQGPRARKAALATQGRAAHPMRRRAATVPLGHKPRQTTQAADLATAEEERSSRRGGARRSWSHSRP